MMSLSDRIRFAMKNAQAAGTPRTVKDWAAQFGGRETLLSRCAAEVGYEFAPAVMPAPPKTIHVGAHSSKRYGVLPDAVVPHTSLVAAGFSVGQTLQLTTEPGRIVLTAGEPSGA